MSVTAEQKADLQWVDGFRAYLEGASKPVGADRLAGWNAAQKLTKTAGGTGGYGPKP